MQRKCGGRAVIECPAGPRSSSVAGITGSREAGRSVGWVIGPGPILLMAIGARGGRKIVILADVTLGARGVNVHTGQSKPRRRMIENNRRPRNRGMAQLARGWPSRCHMIRAGRAVEIFDVT
jgi:hypothetical protein